MNRLVDRFNRVHNKLRISLSEDDNQFCVYYDLSLTYNSRKSETLSFENILRLIRVFVTELGITEIKFTGGDPLERKNVFQFFKDVSGFNEKHNIDIGITTNGYTLFENIELLQSYGIRNININLNTLNPKKYSKSNNGFKLENVLRTIDKSEKLGINPLKINCVVMKGFNDDEILDFVDFIKDRNLCIRFIEFLPFTDKWGVSAYVSVDQIYKKIIKSYSLIKLKTDVLDISKSYKIKNHTGTLGLISSITNHFCSSCNRIRITAEGNMVMCLFSGSHKDLNLGKIINSKGITDNEIASFISDTLFQKDLHHPDVEKLLLLKKNDDLIFRE